MRRSVIIFALLFLNIASFAQWKSYYPEGTESKKEQEKVNNEKSKKIFETHLFSALKAKALENHEESLEAFRKCIEINKTIAIPFYESAVINAENGNYITALEHIKKATTLEPDNRWYLLLYAEILFAKNDFLDAATQYKRLINMEPGNEELYFKLADTYIYANKLRKAIGVYDDLEQYKTPNKRLSIQKHQLYRELKDMQAAINELTSILKVFPNEVDIMEMLAELYLLDDKKEKAFEIFKRLSQISPNNGRNHLRLAEYYRENGDNKQSYKELIQAFKSSELNIDTKVRILISYYELIGVNEDMKNQAYELAKILMDAHPNNLKAIAVFGDILYTDGQYQKAKEQYLIILEKDKSKSQIWGQVLFIQAEQKDFEGMLKTSKNALEYFPSTPVFYYFNGLSNNRFEKYQEAINAFSTGIEFVVENRNLLFEFYSLLAETYHKTNQHILSDKYYEKALEIDSNNLLILNNYAYYLSLRKVKLEKAKEMSYRCNKMENKNATYQDTYAWILYKLREYKEAKEWILKALSNGGDKSPVIVEHYGDILYNLGKIKEAKKQWNKAKEIGGASRFLFQKIEQGKLYE